MSKSSTFSGEAASASDSVSWQQEMPSGATLHGVKEENSSQPPAVGAEHTGAPVSGFSDSEAALKDASYGVKRDASSEVDWLGALQYSVEHAASLRRGELWLLPDEAERLLSYFQSQNLDQQWSLKEVSDLCHPPLPGSRGKDSKHSTKQRKKRKSGPSSAFNAAGGDQKWPRAGSGVAGVVTGADSHGSKVQTRVQKSSNKIDTLSTSSHRAPRLSQSQLKQLPDWAQRLHRLLSLLCQTEVCRPFVSELHVTDPRFPEVYDAIQPALTPLGLSMIVSNLEQNVYQTGLDVFNDVYSVWLCAYRTHPPGSPLWLQAYQASRTFLQQIANQPLKDDFTPSAYTRSGGLASSTAGYAASSDPRPSSAASLSTSSRGRRKSSTSVDQLLQEFLTYHDRGDQAASEPQQLHPQQLRGASASSRHRPRGTAVSASGKRKARTSVPASAITEAERASFQSYLSQLEARHHLMLFEAFRRTAVWKSIESGEVELDDARTSAPVFRKMVAWCRAQLDEKAAAPLDKRRRITSSNFFAADCSASDAVAYTTGGSGKFVPTATGYPNVFRASPEHHQLSSCGDTTAPRLGSSLSHANPSTSSSSSCTSSSDDDDEEEDDDENEHFTDQQLSKPSKPEQFSSVLVS